MPPCVRMRPSSTDISPGPTCFQPLRSLPLKRGFQDEDCGGAAATAKRVETAVTSRIAIHFLLSRVTASAPGRKSSQARVQHAAPYKDKSELQFLEIVVADFDVVERRFGIVVFHEVVLDARFRGVREKVFPIDGPLADIGHAAAKLDGLPHGTLVGSWRRNVLDPVFYMNEREAAGILFEIADRIFAGDADPAEIQFHGDEFRVSFAEKEIVGEFAAERVGGIEFERVIVIGELDAGILAGFAGFIEEIGGPTPAVRLLALLLVNPGANDVGVADDVGG